MVTFYVEKDYDKSKIEFRLTKVLEDVTNRINVGYHFENEEKVKKYLSQVFNLKVEEIDISE